MIFVGIISREKDFEKIKHELSKKKKDIEFIHIDNNNVENLQNIRFDSLVIHEEFQLINHIKALQKIFDGLRYVIVNTDKNPNMDILNGNRLTVITYGLNHKCSVTASSITDDVIMIATQREIINKKGKLHDIAEHRLNTIPDLDTYSHMLIFIIYLLYI